MEAFVCDSCIIFMKLIIIVTIHPEEHQVICMVQCLSLFTVEMNSSDTICMKYHVSYVGSLKNLLNVDLDTIFQLQHVKLLCFKHCHQTVLNYITVNLL